MVPRSSNGSTDDESLVMIDKSQVPWSIRNLMISEGQYWMMVMVGDDNVFWMNGIHMFHDGQNNVCCC